MESGISMSTDSRSAQDITCPKYVRGEGKRCVHYRADGSCVLPEELMCVEWLKRNVGNAPRTPPKSLSVAASTTITEAVASAPSLSFAAKNSPARTDAERSTESARAQLAYSSVVPASVSAQATDLFGNSIAEKPTARSGGARDGAKAPKPGSMAPLVAADLGGPTEAVRDPFRGLSTEDIESFKALNTEVRFEAEALGEWWLVPAYSGKPRKEITPEHAATIAKMLNVFPGARVVSFERVAD